jgi:NRPS condensation-like uncharacterized protein
MANERLHLRSPNINVCLRIVIEGILDKSQAVKALDAVRLRHPLLNSFVETDTDNTPWLVQKDSNLDIECYKSHEMDWQTWYRRTDSIPFDFSNGPLVKFCMITGNNTEIVILGHHIIGDGLGYLNVVKDLLLALDNKLDPSPQVPPFEAHDRYFKETILPDSGVQSYANGLNEEWKRSRTHFSENDYQVFFEQYRKQFTPNFYMGSIQRNDFQNLVEKAKSNGLTVTEIITAAFSLATMDIMGKNEIRLGVAASIRRELVSEPDMCMGNYVTGIATKAYFDQAQDFMTNAGRTAGILREQLANKKNRHLVVHFLNAFDKDLIESLMYAAYGTLEHPVSRQLAKLIGEQPENKGLGVSNLGRHDFSGYKSIKLADVQFIGPAFPANLLTIGIITTNGTLNLCLRYNEGEMGTETVEAIYKKAVALWSQSSSSFAS